MFRCRFWYSRSCWDSSCLTSPHMLLLLHSPYRDLKHDYLGKTDIQWLCWMNEWMNAKAIISSKQLPSLLFLCICFALYNASSLQVFLNFPFSGIDQNLATVSQAYDLAAFYLARHSSTLAWKIPWTEEPGRLQSMGSRRVGHDWATSLSLFTFMHWRRKWQPTPVFLPGESQGRGSPVGCHLWGRTESNTTEVT